MNEGGSPLAKRIKGVYEAVLACAKKEFLEKIEEQIKHKVEEHQKNE